MRSSVFSKSWARDQSASPLDWHRGVNRGFLVGNARMWREIWLYSAATAKPPRGERKEREKCSFSGVRFPWDHKCDCAELPAQFSLTHRQMPSIAHPVSIRICSALMEPANVNYSPDDRCFTVCVLGRGELPFSTNGLAVDLPKRLIWEVCPLGLQHGAASPHFSTRSPRYHMVAPSGWA
jgi:hypothetical protein